MSDADPPEPSRTWVHIAARSLPTLGVVICLLVGIAAWNSAHITYALPHGEGHDVLEGRRAAAGVAFVMAAPALLGAIMTWIRPHRMWVYLVLTAVALAVVVNVIAGSRPTPDY